MPKYINSYGCKQEFPNTKEALEQLRLRDANVVMLEVLELIDRIHSKSMNKEIHPENLSFELHVRQTVIVKTLARLTKKGLLQQDLKHYKLLRGVKDTDYGTTAEEKKTEDEIKENIGESSKYLPMVIGT